MQELRRLELSIMQYLQKPKHYTRDTYNLSLTLNLDGVVVPAHNCFDHFHQLHPAKPQQGHDNVSLHCELVVLVHDTFNFHHLPFSSCLLCALSLAAALTAAVLTLSRWAQPRFRTDLRYVDVNRADSGGPGRSDWADECALR